jgi:hypothetical protein
MLKLFALRCFVIRSLAVTSSEGSTATCGLGIGVEFVFELFQYEVDLARRNWFVKPISDPIALPVSARKLGPSVPVISVLSWSFSIEVTLPTFTRDLSPTGWRRSRMPLSQ